MWCSQHLFRAQLGVSQPSNKSRYICGTSEHGFEGCFRTPLAASLWWSLPAACLAHSCLEFPKLSSAGVHRTTYSAEGKLSVGLSQHWWWSLDSFSLWTDNFLARCDFASASAQQHSWQLPQLLDLVLKPSPAQVPLSMTRNLVSCLIHAASRKGISIDRKLSTFARTETPSYWATPRGHRRTFTALSMWQS